MPSVGEYVRGIDDPQSAEVGTEQTTASTSYTDLATTGPAITTTLRAGQMCLVKINVGFFIDTSPAGARARAGYAVSGAETIAANDTDSAFTSVPADYVHGVKDCLFTATAGGSYTFTLKYRVAGVVTGTFSARRLIVIPFP